MAKMGVVINSGSASIPGDFLFLNWHERLRRARFQGIVNFERCHDAAATEVAGCRRIVCLHSGEEA
jgi:hypothetical protein